MGRAIIFDSEMIRAILGGRKTVMRRPVKVPGGTYKVEYNREEGVWEACFGFDIAGTSADMRDTVKMPYKPGDVLYVKESFYRMPATREYHYKADEDSSSEGNQGDWEPATHMPKEAARIWLKVKDVKLERLQNIKMKDMQAEGIIPEGVTGGQWGQWLRDYYIPAWKSIIQNNKLDYDRYGWDADPWVWVYEFETCGNPEAV